MAMVHRSLMLFGFIIIGFCSCGDYVFGLPVEPNSWPSFQKKNIAALARDGYIKTTPTGYKRSISTLAKNGQLPTFRSPYDETDKQEDENDNTEKRNMASIARMRSFSTIKRNIQALARDGYRGGRGGQYYNPQNDKRNIQSLARNGLIHKRGSDDEYYYPFYQNSIPPLSEVDGPIDYNEIYDLQQSINPDLLPPLSQVFKRNSFVNDYYPEYTQPEYESNNDFSNKRGAFGSPVHGVFRSTYNEPSNRVKRYILSIPDIIHHNDIPVPENEDIVIDDKRSVDDSVTRDNFEKRHIGSLARLGLLPSFRFSGGRYSRSGRARLLLPSQELYRKHSANENFGIRQYIPSAKIESAIYSDDTNIPTAALPAHSHPTGRILRRPIDNELPPPPRPVPKYQIPKHNDALSKNRWRSEVKDIPRFYYFRSLKIPYHDPAKRYLMQPAADNVMLRKYYPNSSLPSRRKNQ